FHSPVREETDLPGPAAGAGSIAAAGLTSSDTMPILPTLLTGIPSLCHHCSAMEEKREKETSYQTREGTYGAWQGWPSRNLKNVGKVKVSVLIY
ncbi:MAG: hypothetical protein ACI4WR_06800, partial [Bulleidia sp.]